MRVVVTPNTGAIMYLPLAEKGTIEEDGKVLDAVEGIEWIGPEDARSLVRFGPGGYEFVLKTQ